jgi:transposase
MHALMVLPADIQDRDVAPFLLRTATARMPTLQRAVADGGYQGAATATAVEAEAGIPLEIVKRSDTTKGFQVLPKRWIVERTFGWLGRCRRLAQALREPHPHACRLPHPRHDPHDATAVGPDLILNLKVSARSHGDAGLARAPAMGDLVET